MSNNKQMLLLETPSEYKTDEPVECLGMTFENDAARRAHFTELLRQKLQDPEFRKIEGFPIGEDEAILALSDPPYYTACPNPWLADFVAEWEAQKPPKPEGYQYHREPFAADVSEGKNDPIYNAHSYHTKVPHKAIMRYILHYTEPGDIVFDGFAGTGMTGVAAQMCGDQEVVESLGYRVEDDGAILQAETDENGKKHWTPFSRLGVRHAILNDLSPAATFIAYNYNTPVDVAAFEKEAKRILAEVEKECGWMYETRHTDGRIGKINYTVWSDVFICPECTGEVVFWEAAVDKTAGKVLKEFPCPHCNASLTKRNMKRAWVTKYDSAIHETIRQAKQVPVVINYAVGKKRFEKEPEPTDLALIDKAENGEIPYWFPTDRMIEGQESRRNDPIGVTHVHHYYTRRNLWTLAKTQALTNYNSPFYFNQTSMILRSTIMNRIVVGYHFHGGGGANGAHLKGTLYVSSLPTETPIPPQIRNKTKANVRVFSLLNNDQFAVIFTQSSTGMKIPSNSMDYIFLDPPFGSNIYYSELNFLWEAWLKVWTNNKLEAIENNAQSKDIDDYRKLMTICFGEAYRILKPGHWMTVEFSNTKAYVWNSIQTALVEAGFIVANVSALNKKQGSFKAVTTPTAVKQDLVISAYKPNGGFEERFRKEATSEEGVWDFVRTHLGYLPVVKRQNGGIQMVPERDPRILFDQMVAYYVRKGYPVPLSSPEFQLGLTHRFSERDGMYFLPNQVAEYDRAKMIAGKILQAALFVSDESSAIQWLRQLLKEKPQTFADVNPQFMQQLGGWRKNEKPLDLRELLQQNFLVYDGKGLVPEQIHAYLSSNWKDMRNLAKDDPALVAKAKDRWYVPDPNKQADLDKLRERSLLREFETYKKSKQRRLKLFRLEAVRAGFQKAWQENDYDTILTIARKIPPKILQEDPKLLMWYDMSLTRTGQME
ncbi:MAG TPA: DNA methylase [Anaerolineae bacterium]|nr:DNA methylase [Anaerolineae bacterium]